MKNRMLLLLGSVVVFHRTRTGVVEKQGIERDQTQRQEEGYSCPFLAQDEIRKKGEKEYAPQNDLDGFLYLRFHKKSLITLLFHLFWI